LDLKDRVAIVTGAANGIGKSIVQKMAALGTKTAILDIDIETADKVASKISRENAESVAIHTDITKSDEIKDVVQQVVERFGKIDILVNNAGWTRVKLFIDEDEAYWDDLIDLNLKGPILMCKAVLPYMIEQKYGKIVNIGSEVARMGMSGQAVYSATKGGIISFTKSLAREVSRFNINVNCVCPGPIESALLNTQSKNSTEYKSLLKMLSIRRYGKPSEVASMVAFLSSPETDFVVGEIISVAGGWGMAG